jgi:predicted Mrr-cat superfamily restriction endonuclease
MALDSTTEEQPPLKARSPQVWLVRAGRGAVHAGSFLNESMLAIGFGVVESVESLSWDEISALARKAMPDEPPVTIGLAVGALSRLANDLAVGDFVITPEPGGTLLFGEVTGPYGAFVNPVVEDYHHTRGVRWFARHPRSRLSERARNSIGSILTLVNAVRNLEHLRNGTR